MDENRWKRILTEIDNHWLGKIMKISTQNGSWRSNQRSHEKKKHDKWKCWNGRKDCLSFQIDSLDLEPVGLLCYLFQIMDHHLAPSLRIN